MDKGNKTEFIKGDLVIVHAEVFAGDIMGTDKPTLKDAYSHLYIRGKFDRDTIHLIYAPVVKGTMRRRGLWRMESVPSWRGMVVGYSYRATGYPYASNGSYDDYEQGYLDSDRRHRVVMVESLEGGLRYYKPIACLEEDLEPC